MHNGISIAHTQFVNIGPAFAALDEFVVRMLHPNNWHAFFAGTINQTGELEIRVTAAASNTTLARIIEAVEQALMRRLRGEPLAYVLGTAAFRHLELAVDPRVLIPRPETECLVDEVLALTAGSPLAMASSVTLPKVSLSEGKKKMSDEA